jgi:hypothetical protein
LMRRSGPALPLGRLFALPCSLSEGRGLAELEHATLVEVVNLALA